MSKWSISIRKNQTEFHKESPRSDAPNQQNAGYVDVPVENGTIRAKRYGCAGCEKQFSASEVSFIVRSERLDAWVVSSYGSIYTHAAGSTDDHKYGTQSWPFCDDCLEDRIPTRMFDTKPAMKVVEGEGEEYHEVKCGYCGERVPEEDSVPFVLNPSRIVHKNGGPGMMAPSYPVIRGKSTWVFCGQCEGHFEPKTVTVEGFEVNE